MESRNWMRPVDLAVALPSRISSYYSNRTQNNDCQNKNRELLAIPLISGTNELIRFVNRKRLFAREYSGGMRNEG